MSKNSAKRLEILSETKISPLYSPPQWDQFTRIEYFYVPSDVQRELKNFGKHSVSLRQSNIIVDNPL